MITAIKSKIPSFHIPSVSHAASRVLAIALKPLKAVGHYFALAASWAKKFVTRPQDARSFATEENLFLNSRAEVDRNSLINALEQIPPQDRSRSLILVKTLFPGESAATFQQMPASEKGYLLKAAQELLSSEDANDIFEIGSSCFTWNMNGFELTAIIRAVATLSPIERNSIQALSFPPEMGGYERAKKIQALKDHSGH